MACFIAAACPLFSQPEVLIWVYFNCNWETQHLLFPVPEVSEMSSHQSDWLKIWQHPQEELEVEMLPKVVSWHKVTLHPPKRLNHWSLAFWSVNFYFDNLLVTTRQRSCTNNGELWLDNQREENAWSWKIWSRSCMSMSSGCCKKYFPKQSFLPDWTKDLKLLFFPWGCQ